MYVYGIFFVPTFFSLLVGVNLLVWARARINYVFIFGAYLFDYMCITPERAHRAGCTDKDGSPGIL